MEPHNQEQQRNLQNLWRAPFLTGVEWDLLDSVYQYDWDFSNLEREFEEGGKFHGIGSNNNVYLFGQTETPSPSVPVLIPTLVAVVAPRPPSMEIAFRSVQRGEKEIVPMSEMNMDWFPYIGLNLPQIFVLVCTQMRQERRMQYQFCVPYLMNPNNQEEKEQEDPNYQEAKAYYESMRLYKIYPQQTPNTPVIEIQSKYINFYYGEAHEII